ncbi:uncharacterized protein LOC143868680 [Tasmannia lanceolata]|uniref:uncharacterized protein LOC143868680 n=1 Tax=Tasmannia lanceolata TaxID=3420 RepID=UPI0040649288
MKKWAGKKRRAVEYQVGDHVLVKLLAHQRLQHNRHKGLARRYEGPYEITKRIGKAAYQLQLPPELKIHPVFHVSLLKPYHVDGEDPSRGESRRFPTTIVASYDKEVDYILADREVRRSGIPKYKEYLVKWKSLPDNEASWETENALQQFKDAIERFKEERTMRASPD